MYHLLKERHRKIRAVCKGARVGLLNEGEGYTAYMSCAATLKPLVGHLGKWRSFGAAPAPAPKKRLFDDDDAPPPPPQEEAVSLTIPPDKMYDAMKILQNHLSVALIDAAMLEKATVYVAIVVQHTAADVKLMAKSQELEAMAAKPKRNLFGDDEKPTPPKKSLF